MFGCLLWIMQTRFSLFFQVQVGQFLHLFLQLQAVIDNCFFNISYVSSLQRLIIHEQNSLGSTMLNIQSQFSNLLLIRISHVALFYRSVISSNRSSANDSWCDLIQWISEHIGIQPEPYWPQCSTSSTSLVWRLLPGIFCMPLVWCCLSTKLSRGMQVKP